MKKFKRIDLIFMSLKCIDLFDQIYNEFQSKMCLKSNSAMMCGLSKSNSRYHTNDAMEKYHVVIA